MKKYAVYAPYVTTRFCGEIEAESEEEAIEKAYEMDLIDYSIGLCWHCSEDYNIGELIVEDNKIFAEEV